MTSSMTLPDGRTLAWAEYGDPTGRPLIFLHGTPGSRLQIAPIDHAARAAGVRVIAPDRPGCGQSTPDAAASFSSCATDLGELIDHLSLTRPVIAGASGGGGYALQSAMTLGPKLSRVVLVCTMLPGAPKAAFATQLPPVKLVFALARHAPSIAGLLLRQQVRISARLDPAKMERMSKGLPAGDRALYADPDLLAAMTADSAEALTQGTAATMATLTAYATQPPIDAAGLQIPVTLLHGDEDRNVPLAVAQWATARIPGAELQIVKGGGHLFLAQQPSLLLDLL